MFNLNARKVVLALLAFIMMLFSLAGVLRFRPSPAAEREVTAKSGAASGQLRAGPGRIEGATQPTQVAAASPETAAPDPQESMPRETRALWVSRWDLEKTDVQTVVDKAAEAHFNVIYFQVRGTADAMYPSNLEPWSAGLTGTLGKDPGYDPLAEMIDRAHAKGIEVHAWVNVYPVWMGSTPPPASATPTPMYQDFNARYGQDWLQWKGGQPMHLGDESYLWANPAHPAVSDHVVAVCKDLLERYPVDGLHLDYVRYAGPEYSDDPVSNQAYAAAHANDPNLSRADWQRAQVTALVQRIHDEVLPVRPGARLTTTAWPVYQDRWGWYKGKDGYNAFYQDSQSWARNGTVSAITPMLYGVTIHDHLDMYETLARDYVQGAQPGGVVLGIGGDYDSFSALADRIAVTRQVGARGQAFFSYGALDEHNYWPALRDGPYAEPAQPNWG